MNATSNIIPVKPSANRLLNLLGTVTIPATTGNFVGKDMFVVNTDCKAGLMISFLGGNFKEWFLGGDSKPETSIKEQTLHYAMCREMSRESSIIAEIGGEAKAETTLPAMFFLMDKQGAGEGGVLMNCSNKNAFYIRDLTGMLRRVYTFWGGDGWHIYADDLLAICIPGTLVFYRNSVLESSEISAPALA